MAVHPDVLILGGGVIGLTTAYHLAAEGVAVTVVERGDLGHEASWAGAGIIPPGDTSRAQSPIGRLRAFSSSLFPTLSRQLRDETDIDNGYFVCGGLELDGGNGSLTTEWREEGVAFEELDGAGLRRLEPGLSPDVTRGWHIPGIAQVRNPRHIKALAAACEIRAVGLMPGCAAGRLLHRGERITSVETEQGKLAAGKFLVAAGAWADALLSPLGWTPGITPVRGQIALLDTGDAAERPVVMQGKQYLVPRPDGRVLAGSTEEDAGFDARPTASGVSGLLAFAERTVPRLRDAVLERCWAGLRPGSPDGLPFLGPVPGFSNLFVAAGHFRAGIQLSPATGLLMTELLLGRVPTVPLAPFAPGRRVVPAARAAFRS